MGRKQQTKERNKELKRILKQKKGIKKRKHNKRINVLKIILK